MNSAMSTRLATIVLYVLTWWPIAASSAFVAVAPDAASASMPRRLTTPVPLTQLLNVKTCPQLSSLRPGVVWSGAKIAVHPRNSRSHATVAAARNGEGGKEEDASSPAPAAVSEKRDGLLSVSLRALLRGATLPVRLTQSAAAKVLHPRRRGSDKPHRSTPGFTIKECLLSIGIYLALGVLAFHVMFEHWSTIDALYFAVATFTTVGYGDLVPTHRLGKLFTCFFGMGGIAILGIMLASIGSNIVEAEVQALEKAREARIRTMMGVFEGMPDVLHRVKKGGRKALPRIDGEDLVKSTEEEKPWRRKTVGGMTRKYLPIFLLLFLGGSVIGRLEGWKWSDCLYYSIITAGTVGFGDLSPHTRAARLFAVVFIPLAVAAAGEFLGTVASAILDRRRDNFYHDLVETDLTVDDLTAMDENRNGEVSRVEYVEFMLVKMNLVDRGILDDLHAQFDRLDVTESDTLSKQDLELMAKLRSGGVSQVENAADEINGRMSQASE